MFERFTQPIAPLSTFFMRLLYTVALGIMLIIIGLAIGMVGYHVFESMHWIDAFVNAAMILSSMGPLTPLQTDAGKIFAGIYALFSGLVFVSIVGIIFSPVVHRFFHKFHLETDGEIEQK